MDYPYTEEEITRLLKEMNGETRGSVTTNTAFHGLRMPLEKAVAILIHLQDTYLQFQESDEKQIKDGIGDDDEDNPLYNRRNTKNFDFIGTPARNSTQELADLFQVEKKSIQAYFKRLADWCPEVFGLGSYADEEWFKNLKTEESRKDWTKIFNLLFRPEADTKGHFWEDAIERSYDDICFILVYREEPLTGIALSYMPDEYYDYIGERLNEEEMWKYDLDEDTERQWRREWEIKKGYRKT